MGSVPYKKRHGGFPHCSVGKESACNAEDQVWSLGQEDPLEKEMATHFSIPAWRIPWTEDAGMLQPMCRKSWTQLANEPPRRHGLPRWLSGSESACQCRRYRRCGFDPWVGKNPWERKCQPTPVFLPGKFRATENWKTWQAIVHGVTKSWTQLSMHACMQEET